MRSSYAEAFVDTQEASQLMNISPRAIRKRISESKTSSLKARGSKGGGKNGVAHFIPLSELPVEARLRYTLAQEGVGRTQRRIWRATASGTGRKGWTP